MYTLVLTLHSWIRWIAIVCGFGATLAAMRDTDQKPNSSAERWGLFAMMTLDIQMLVGLALYLVLSPLTKEAMANFSLAMRTPQLRFWGIEHVATMMAAVILAHVGRVLARTARTSEAKRRRLLACFGVATLLMLVGTPWPGFANARPLFRLAVNLAPWVCVLRFEVATARPHRPEAQDVALSRRGPHFRNSGELFLSSRLRDLRAEHVSQSSVNLRTTVSKTSAS